MVSISKSAVIRHPILAPLIVAGACWAPAVDAAPPDAGQTLESIRPAPAPPPSPGSPLPAESTEQPAIQAPEGARIPIKEFRFTGVRVFAQSDLQALIQEGIGKTLTLPELNALVARIGAYYRSHGYLLARAYIPAQDVRDGIVEIVVLEGRLGQVGLENKSPVSETTLHGFLSALQSGDTVEAGALERQLLLMNDLPGVEVRSTLRPGAAVGTSDLDVRARTTRRVSGAVDADNYGNRYTGAARAGVTANVNSLAGWGDQLTVRGIRAGSGMSYGRLAWQTPIGGRGIRAGAAWSSMTYRLQKDFAALEAHGTARVGTLWMSYPIVRSQGTNFSAQLSHDRKKLEDRVDSVSLVTDKDVNVSTLGLVGDHIDRLGAGGFTGYSLAASSGEVSLDPTAVALDQSATGHGIDGRYRKLSYNIARLQRLTAGTSLYASVSGQVASKNLDSSEKLSLGGPYGVRAYPQGEAPGDDLWLATLELRWALPVLPEARLVAFADSGGVHINHNPIASDTDNTRHLASKGIGFLWNKADRYALRAHLAWRATGEPTSDTDRRPRAWVQLAIYF